jgi:hypothetical protein
MLKAVWESRELEDASMVHLKGRVGEERRREVLTLQDRELCLLALMLNLLGSGIDLLLALLGTTTETEDEMEGGFLWLTRSAMYSLTCMPGYALLRMY